MRKSRKKSKGLTLIEVLIVVGILTFLVLMVLLAFRNQIFKGNDAKRKGDIHKIQVAIEEYEKDYNCYPLPSQVVCDPGTGLQPYLDKIPCDPTTDASYYYEPEDATCPEWYRLYTVLENEKDADLISSIGPQGDFNYYASSPNAPIPIPSSSGDSDSEESDFYGCRSGVCVPILWDSSRPGPECDPNYQSPSCYSQCGPPANECEPWNE
jgi:type II secretory pathway pseudopilin PulG